MQKLFLAIISFLAALSQARYTYRDIDKNGNYIITYLAPSQPKKVLFTKLDFASNPPQTYTQEVIEEEAAIFNPSVKIFEDDSFIIAWNTDNKIYAQGYLPNGQKTGQKMLLGQNQGACLMIATLPGKRFVFSTHFEIDSQQSTDIFYTIFDFNGTVIQNFTQANNFTFSHQAWPQTYSSHSGDFIVIWESFFQDTRNINDLEWGIYANIYDSQGQVKVQTFRIHHKTNDSQIREQGIALMNSNAFYITFRESKPHHNKIIGYDVNGKIVFPEQQVTETELPNFNFEGTYDPVISIGDQDEKIVNWFSQNEDQQIQLNYRVYDQSDKISSIKQISLEIFPQQFFSLMSKGMLYFCVYQVDGFYLLDTTNTSLFTFPEVPTETSKLPFIQSEDDDDDDKNTITVPQEARKQKNNFALIMIVSFSGAFLILMISLFIYKKKKRSVPSILKKVATFKKKRATKNREKEYKSNSNNDTSANNILCNTSFVPNHFDKPEDDVLVLQYSRVGPQNQLKYNPNEYQQKSIILQYNKSTIIDTDAFQQILQVQSQGVIPLPEMIEGGQEEIKINP